MNSAPAAPAPAAASTVAAVSVLDVTKRFGETLVLDRVSLEVGAGEIFFLLGPSGCGKTTLLRTIAGFYIPDSGQVRFGHEDVTRLPPHRRNTAMMFQSYALWPHLTIFRNVAFGLEERKVPRAEIGRRVREALSLVKMEALAERRVHEISGGQQQRVALARALVVRPRCLLLDEPLSNLDAKLRQEMRGEIRRVCRESGLTAVYVSHDQKEALSIGDRIAVMHEGRVCQVGAPREIYARPQTRFVAEFVGETNLLRGTIAGIDEGGSGHGRGGEAIVQTVLGALRGTFTEEPGRLGLRRGDEVLLSVRPESWKLSAQPGLPGRGAVKGRVVETTYLGEMARHRFLAEIAGEGGGGSATGEKAGRASGGSPHGSELLTIYELNPRPTAESGVSYASVDPADVVILPPEGA